MKCKEQVNQTVTRTKIDIEQEIKKVAIARVTAAKKIERCDKRLEELNKEMEAAQ